MVAHDRDGEDATTTSHRIRGRQRSIRAPSSRPSPRSHVYPSPACGVHYTRRVSVRPSYRRVPIITTAPGVMDVAALAAATDTTTETANATAAATEHVGSTDATTATAATTTTTATTKANNNYCCCCYSDTAALRPPKVRVRSSS